MLVQNLASTLLKLVYEKKRCLFYRYVDGQGEGESHRSATVYSSWTDIPVRFRNAVIPFRFTNIMYFRLRRGRAKLLILAENESSVQAYGWIQSWTHFRRDFEMLALDGIMLGPYWTAPRERGKGLYGRLLSHSLHLCPKNKPILIYTSPENTASQNGILKAGFAPLGQWDIIIWFRVFVIRREVRN